MLNSTDALKRNIEAAHRELVDSGETQRSNNPSLQLPSNNTEGSSPIPSSLVSQKSKRRKTTPALFGVVHHEPEYPNQRSASLREQGLSQNVGDVNLNSAPHYEHVSVMAPIED